MQEPKRTDSFEVHIILLSIISSLISGLIIPVLGNPFGSLEPLLPEFMQHQTGDSGTITELKVFLPPLLLTILLVFVLLVKKIKLSKFSKYICYIMIAMIAFLYPFFADIR
jgi:amino acid permease